MKEISREEQLKSYIQSFNSMKGNPHNILTQMQRYSNTIDHLMNIGMAKGQTAVHEFIKCKPKIAIELGTYVAFSAILFANALPEDGKLYTFESSPHYARIAQYFINLSGLEEKVEIILGDACKTLPLFKKKIDKVDFVFLDHWMKFYLPELRLMETLQFFKPGTLIISDNIIKPGAPELSAYTQGTFQYRQQVCMNPNPHGIIYTGDPSIVYDSHTTELIENDAMEITYVKSVPY